MIVDLLFLLGLAFVIARVMEKYQLRQSGKKLREDLESAFSSGHEFASIDQDEFQNDLDLGFYTEKRYELEQHGFQWVDDVEDLTLTRQFPPNRTFQRLMVTSDGKVRANIYHLRPRGLLYRFLALIRVVSRDYYVLELATEFSGGFTLITNNTKGFPVLDMPQELDIMALAPDSETSELVHVHRGRVEQFLQNHPEEEFHGTTTREGLLQAIERILLLCQRFRAENGYSMDELQRVSSKLAGKSAIKELHQELNKRS